MLAIELFLEVSIWCEDTLHHTVKVTSILTLFHFMFMLTGNALQFKRTVNTCSCWVACVCLCLGVCVCVKVQKQS